MVDESRLLTLNEVAERLRVSLRTVREYVRTGSLPALNIGTGRVRPLWRVDEIELETWLTGRATNGRQPR